MTQDWLSIALFTVSIPMSVAFLYQNVLRKAGSATAVRSLSSSVGSTTNNVADLRKEYSQLGLTEQDLPLSGPMELFQTWINEACQAKVIEPNAMCVTTVVQNKPSSRFVLLKGYDERGFVWYTNYHSRKGKQLEANDHACIAIWWGELERQVRIEGIVEKVTEQESDDYFHSRPRGSQIGAWTSHQSEEIEDRQVLEEQEKSLSKKFEQIEIIPRPPHWGGYRLKPNYIEFWKGRRSRLHDRIVYEKEEGEDGSNTWKRKRLQP